MCKTFECRRNKSSARRPQARSGKGNPYDRDIRPQDLRRFHIPAGTLGAPIWNVTLYSPKLKPLNLESEKDEFRVGKMDKLYQSLLHDCIENGVEFAAGTRFVSAEKLTGETRIKLEKNGHVSEIIAKVLIGADGANSNVAKSLGLDENREWIVGYEEVFHVENSPAPNLVCIVFSTHASRPDIWHGSPTTAKKSTSASVDTPPTSNRARP